MKLLLTIPILLLLATSAWGEVISLSCDSYKHHSIYLNDYKEEIFEETTALSIDTTKRTVKVENHMLRYKAEGNVISFKIAKNKNILDLGADKSIYYSLNRLNGNLKRTIYGFATKGGANSLPQVSTEYLCTKVDALF